MTDNTPREAKGGKVVFTGKTADWKPRENYQLLIQLLKLGRKK
jgi:hypothetical protein